MRLLMLWLHEKAISVAMTCSSTHERIWAMYSKLATLVLHTIYKTRIGTMPMSRACVVVICPMWYVVELSH
jgi:hypothetical protein